MFAAIRSFDDHWVFSGIYDELEIEKAINEVMSKFWQHKLAHSTVVKEMLLNCLCFTYISLYIDYQYFETHPIERLVDPWMGITLNDTVPGRTLD